MNARVFVTLKNGVLDPQGKAVARSLGGMGYSEVQDVRLGKVLELKLDSTDANAERARLEEMCKRLLANTVIEDYRIEILG
jgi:phosphoribosylformylglycinamidine synthase